MAQKRRKEMLDKRRQRRTTLLCVLGGVGAVALSVAVCLLVFGGGQSSGGDAPASVDAAPSYDASQPFSAADLTAAQLDALRAQGKMTVSDGPRGVSVGDSLDTLLSRFPSSYSGAQPDEEQILYCADYFENANGVMTALPPRGLLSVENSQITVTLLAPTSAYPPGTRENYGDYEHIYCRFTVEPDGMTVSGIALGIER